MKATELFFAEWKARKKRADLTVVEIAKTAGLHLNTVHNIFNGKTKDCGNKTILKIERALKDLEKSRKKNYRRGENALLTHPQGN